MELREAIVTAGKFLWVGKQNSPLKNIRFLPRLNGPHAIYANNGPEGVFVEMDEGVEVPNCCLDGEKLRAIAKDTKHLDPPKLVDSKGDGTWDVGGVTLKGADVGAYPALPDGLVDGEWTPCPDWWAVEALLHVVSKDKQRPDLMCLRFAPGSVDATDTYRVARAFIAGEWGGLVSASAFRSWPKGPVEYLFGESTAAFRIGDQVRMCAMRKGRFEDCAKVLPAHWSGSRVVVDTEELRSSVKRVKGLAARVQLSVGSLAMGVTGGGYANEISVRLARDLPIHDGDPTVPTTIERDAKQVFDALETVRTPRVQIGFTTPDDPLRIDAGPLAVSIWGFNAG